MRKGSTMPTEKKEESKMGLSFSIRRGRLLIYQATIRMLSNPEYIRFLFNSKERRIAIQSCEAIDRNAIRLTKPIGGERFQYEISSSPLLSVIYKSCQWNPDQTYLVYGRLFKRNHLVDYQLDSAIQIAADQFIDPENVY